MRTRRYHRGRRCRKQLPSLGLEKRGHDWDDDSLEAWRTSPAKLGPGRQGEVLLHWLVSLRLEETIHGLGHLHLRGGGWCTYFSGVGSESGGKTSKRASAAWDSMLEYREAAKAPGGTRKPAGSEEEVEGPLPPPPPQLVSSAPYRQGLARSWPAGQRCALQSSTPAAPSTTQKRGVGFESERQMFNAWPPTLSRISPPSNISCSLSCFIFLLSAARLSTMYFS